MMLRWVMSLVGLVAIAAAQGGQSLFVSVRPQLSITVRRDVNVAHADLVEVLSIDADYPPEQLQLQILALGQAIHSEPRGLSIVRHSVSGEDSRFTSVKASFAVDDLIDRNTGHFHLTEIVQAFAKPDGQHPVTGLSLSFVGEKPKKDTLLEFGNEKGPVQVQGDFNPTFNAIEYRVKINTKTIQEIQIPESKEQIPAPKPSTVARGIDGILIGLIAVAAIALGALVYSLLSRSPSKRA